METTLELNVSTEAIPEEWLNKSTLEFLSEWQRIQLNNLKSGAGVRCLLNMWLNFSYEYFNGSYCNATWDNIYCWPPTPADTVVTRLCSEAFHETQPAHAGFLEGNATRTCLANGSWSQGVRTNYNECANSFEANNLRTQNARKLVSDVQHILFFGSIVSLVCLSAALAIFYHFKCLWCDRVTIQAHLMIALMLRFLLLVTITEPFLFERSNNYRTVDWVCKAIICIFLYATVASVSWMFILGQYLNSSLTTIVLAGVRSQRHFTLYYIIGWGCPAALVMVYVIFMVLRTQQDWCWKGYANMPEMWILIVPMILALMLNLCFLVNIVRIVFQKVRRSRLQRESSQLLATVKATVVLFFVLGVNNLLMAYNPGGKYERYYIITNSLLGSTQGIVVACLYCFNNKEVHEAVKRSYNRFTANRNLETSSRRQPQRTGETRE